MAHLPLPLLLVVLSLSIADDFETVRNWEELDHAKAFQKWQLKYNKTYGDNREYEHRFLIFLDNWKMINDFNLRGDRNFTLGMNAFGDLTDEEFRYQVHGHLNSCLLKKNDNQTNTTFVEREVPSTKDTPPSIDWTNYNGKNYVSPVQNQGVPKKCGSCWAFAATSGIESRSAIKYGQSGSQIVELSEQQLMDCSTRYGNNGCTGGYIDTSFRYAMDNKGLCTESNYPYEAQMGSCKQSTCGQKYDPVRSIVYVQPQSESALREVLLDGPVAAAVQADQSAFEFYSGGIMDGLCGTSLDHGVLVVGYGTQSGMDYWKIKNSWGTDWGEDGYIRICRNCNRNGNKGECGILSSPMYPIIN